MFDVLPLPFMFGLNALQASPSGAEVDLTNNVNSCTNPVITATTTCPLTQGSFAQGFPALAAGATPAQSGRWQYTDPNPHRSYVMQWNANFQRQLTQNTSFTVAYAGSRAIHNPFQTDTLNTCFPSKTSAGWLFPNPVGSCAFVTSPAPTGIVPGTMVNPFFSGLMLSAAFQSQAWYRSLQVNFTDRLTHGLHYEISFTWQRSMDTSSGSFAGDNYASNPTAATPWWDLNIIKGLSDFNISRNLSINWLYNIPTPKSFAGPAGWVARGWSVGGVLDLSDGVPMWPLGGLSADPLGQLNSEPMDVLSLAPGCTTKNAVQPGNLQYLRPECFTYPLAPSMAFALQNCDQNPPLGNNGARGSLASFNLPPLTCVNLLGNLPRNSIIGPGLFNMDMSFIKDNHISKFGETFNIQFRAELFNILNHVNFPAPLDNLDNMDPLGVPGFGLIDTDTQVPMREIQFALKIVF